MNIFKRNPVFFLLFCLISLNISAQENNDNKTLSPYFVVKSDDPGTDFLPLKATSAKVNIVGVIADVSITQVYKNEGKNVIEAIYTFPSSTNAAVYYMEMTIGKRTIVAEIKEKKQAREEYEKAKEEGQRASLLEEQRPNVFQMNVANIMPGDEIRVRMKYTELLIPESGIYKFVYPTVVGPRYSNKNAATAPPNDQFVASPYTKQGVEPAYTFDLGVGLSAGMPIQNIVCNSHKIKISYPTLNSADIKLDSTETKGGNRDFILEYSLAGNNIESGLLLYENKDEKFFLLMLQPPKNIKKEEIPPREYIFIMDVSGSMQGFPIEISKKLIRNLVANLRATDQFNILLFAGSSGWVFEKSMNATSENVEKAMLIMDQQQGGGGTEILSALKNALEYPRANEDIARSYVIATDGYVDVEKETFDLIRNNCDKANFFTFGIGSSVNRYILEGMAHVGHGMPMVIDKPEVADAQAEKFRNYINNPLLTQIKRELSRFDAYDIEPLTIPDILGERPVIIFGKYKGLAAGTITIKGRSGKKRYVNTIDVSKYQPSEANSALRYLWARERIRLLDDYNQVGTDDSKIKEVTELGLKYNLLTAYTSFVAIDKFVNVDAKGKSTTVEQELPLPQGVSNSAVGFEPGATNVNNFRNGENMLADSTVIIFHKSISFEPAVPDEKALKADLENRIISRLNPCLVNADALMDSITITINADGNIKNIRFLGATHDKRLEVCLRAAINTWNFSFYRIKKEWQISIKF